jgi:hypothetical protein
MCDGEFDQGHLTASHVVVARLALADVVAFDLT